jgi:hypothetical protein
MVTLDQAIDTVMQLPLEQQDMLIEIIRSRQIEHRREEIASDARQAIEAFKTGQLKPQSVDGIISELRPSLIES